MPTLHYQTPSQSDRHSRLGILSICFGLGGLALLLLAMVGMKSGSIAKESAEFSVLAYIVCLLLGLILSTIGFFRSRRHRVLCFVAFMISLGQVLIMLGVAFVVATLMTRE